MPPPRAPRLPATSRRNHALALLGLWLSVAFGAGCASSPDVQTVPVRSEIVSPSRLYSIVPKSVGWLRVANPAEMGTDADVALFHPAEGVTVFVYVVRGARESVDELVLARRQLILANNEVLSFGEVRRFVEGGSFRPVSIATYQVRRSPAVMESLVVSAIVRAETALVEIIAMGGAPPQTHHLVDDLVAGLRIPANGVEQP